MPLRIRLEGGLDWPAVICDLCGEEITNARDGNYEWREENANHWQPGVERDRPGMPADLTWGTTCNSTGWPGIYPRWGERCRLGTSCFANVAGLGSRPPIVGDLDIAV